MVSHIEELGKDKWHLGLPAELSSCLVTCQFRLYNFCPLSDLEQEATFFFSEELRLLIMEVPVMGSQEEATIRPHGRHTLGSRYLSLSVDP